MLHLLTKVVKTKKKHHNLAKRANLQFIYMQENIFLYSSHSSKIQHTQAEVVPRVHCCHRANILSSKDLHKDFFWLLCPMFRSPSPPELLLTPFLC